MTVRAACTIVRVLGGSDLVGTKGAEKQCMWQYCEHEKEQGYLRDAVHMFLDQIGSWCDFQVYQDTGL